MYRSGTHGFGGGGPATRAALEPAGIAVDAAGHVFIADFQTHRIRMVSDALP